LAEGVLKESNIIVGEAKDGIFSVSMAVSLESVSMDSKL
jgi:hypothetical protein